MKEDEGSKSRDEGIGELELPKDILPCPSSTKLVKTSRLGLSIGIKKSTRLRNSITLYSWRAVQITSASFKVSQCSPTSEMKSAVDQ